MTCEVFGCGANGDGTLEDLETDIRPLANRLEVDAAVDQGLSKVSPPSTKSVGADGNGTRNLVGFEEFDSLRNVVRYCGVIFI